MKFKKCDGIKQMSMISVNLFKKIFTPAKVQRVTAEIRVDNHIGLQ